MWRIHEALAIARRQHPEVDQTLRPREEERYDGLLGLGRRLERRAALPPGIGVGTFADMLWGLINVGTYSSLVIERDWSLDQYRRLGAHDTPAPDRRLLTVGELSTRSGAHPQLRREEPNMSLGVNSLYDAGFNRLRVPQQFRIGQGQIPWGFSSRMPWAASAPALVGLPLRMYSKPTAIIAPMIGPTR